VADTLVFMDRARILEQGPPRKIIMNAQQQRTRDFLSKAL
jgi:ABC-type polar amino acid transport system ATPase subunit